MAAIAGNNTLARARMAGRSFRSNGNGRARAIGASPDFNQLTNGQREELRQTKLAQQMFDATSTKRDKFGEDVSDLNKLLDEPLWSRITVAADGATATPNTVAFFLGAGDGIDQSRFVTDRKMDGTMDFKIESVALAIQARAGQANFDALQFNGAMFGEIAAQTEFNFPLEGGMMQETERAAFAADASAGAVRLESVTGYNPFGWVLSSKRDLKWAANTNMVWTLRFPAGITFATPPDGTANFIATLVLYGYKVQSIVG